MNNFQINQRDKKRLQELVVVRDMTPDDVDDVIQIQLDPLVAPNQYKTNDSVCRQKWADMFTGKMDTDCTKTSESVILFEGTVIGHVGQSVFEHGGKKVVYCGWNLAPEYWGRGIMCIALSKLFDDWFTKQGVTCVRADCFRNNKRCVRLLEKLGFVPERISLLFRIVIVYYARCFYWHLGFRLNAETWLANEVYGRSVQ